MKLKPLNNSILFKFVDACSNTAFREDTSWGFAIKGKFEESVDKARWGEVIAIGPDVGVDIFVGCKIFIEKMMWTKGFKYDGKLMWKTDETKVLCVS